MLYSDLILEQCAQHCEREMPAFISIQPPRAHRRNLGDRDFGPCSWDYFVGGEQDIEVPMRVQFGLTREPDLWAIGEPTVWTSNWVLFWYEDNEYGSQWGSALRNPAKHRNPPKMPDVLGRTE